MRKFLFLTLFFVSFVSAHSQGVTYSKNTWTDLSDFNVNTVGATLVGGKIQMVTGSTVFNNSLELKDTTCLAHWKLTVKMRMTSGQANNYGPSIGLKSSNPFGPCSSVLFLNQNSSDGNKGRMEYFAQTNAGGWNSQWRVGAGSTVPNSSNDMMLVIIERNNLVMRMYMKNLTTNTIAADTSFTLMNYNNGNVVSPANTGKFTIFNHGGTVLIDSIAVEKGEIMNPDLAIIGDSKSTGYGVTSFSRTWVNQLQQVYPKTVLAAGFADRTGEALSHVWEIINLHPKYALLAIGSNDLRSGIGDAVWKQRYQTITSRLEAAGITVLHILPMKESVDLTAQKNWVVATYPGKYIDTWTPSVPAGFLVGDQVHLSDSGNARTFRAIAQALPNMIILPPTANAGTAQNIYLPLSTINLTGSGTSPNTGGSVNGFSWAIVSAPAGSTATITTPNVANTTVTGLIQGLYTFRLTVTDNLGTTDTADVGLTVNAANTQPPTANPGSAQTIIAPLSSVSLSGSGTSPNTGGSITAYAWSKFSGPAGAVTFSAPNSANTNVSNLVPGTYVFRLTVTDNQVPGVAGYGDVTITVRAASILNPTDDIITYNSAAPPTQPADGVIGKWVRTRRVSWNTDAWKAYIYKTVPFRLLYPKSYNPTANDGKRYPMLIFWHGLGEAGTMYDNEYSLYHGAQGWTNAVNADRFDGYILVMQSTGSWGEGHNRYVTEIIDYMVENNKLSPFQISVNGLSAGGYNSWNTMELYPSYIAACLPMSGISIYDTDPAKGNAYKFTPIWYFQGGLDGSPHPNTAQQVVDYINSIGGNLKYTLYSDLGHGTWDRAWGEADFFPALNRAYSANPYPLFKRTEFCPGDPINVTIGVAPGYNEYRWRKDGQPIAGATSNTIQATSPGVYSAQLRKGNVWSEWSRVPVEIKIKAPTVTPPISVLGLMSNVIPAPDNDTVKLRLPSGYISYEWQKVGNSTVIGTDSILKVTTPGDYIARVNELYGCSSSFSTPFKVINANGPNRPDGAINLIASTLSKTSVKLDWSDNPTSTYDETNFEIYQGTQAGGPYKLAAITGANVLTRTITGLDAGVAYFYKIRAVNNTAAAANLSNEANATTQADIIAPTAPANLVITSTTRTSITLSWSPSTDDVGVNKYVVYVNGVESYPTTATTFTVMGLQKGQSYNFAVRAKDLVNNVSPFSNQITGQPLLTGLSYKYYTFTGNWNNLPDFNTLTPVTTGTMANVAITPRTQDDNFAFLWEGYLNVTVAGTYNFRTNSDDGSKLYLGALGGTSSPYSFGATALVNNDGLHGTQDVTSANITLSVGVYPIAMTFYEQGGGEAMTVSWRRGSDAFVAIPNSAFSDAPVNNGSAPTAPSNLIATAAAFNQINLTWTDNSNNETGFEIWRSTNSTTGFAIVGRTDANTSSFSDVDLTSSTTFYYRIRSIGQFGESALVENMPTASEASWLLNNNYNDASGNGRTLTQTANPGFSSTDKKEGTHSMTLNGTTQYVTIPNTGSFLQNTYSAKSVAFWMKSASNTGNRMILDIGGNDDGLALRLNSNTIIAGVASGNISLFRRNFSAPYTSTDWNHIALVYSTNTLRLYINGVLASGSITNLLFTSLGTTSNGSRIGSNNGTNAFDITSGLANFSGLIDDFEIYGRALTQSEITSLMNTGSMQGSFATTLALPAAPAVPANLVASGVSGSKINVSWNDVANETKYELFRSSLNNSNYLLLGTLPANTTSYVDSGLFGNSIFYYKVRAVNVGGNSAYSTEDSAKTKNVVPVITDVTNRSARYDVVTVIPFSSVDADGDALTYTIENKPGFGVFVDNGNKTATLTLTPSVSDQNVYSNIRVIVADTHGGADTTVFNLTVNDNYDPSITAIPNYTVIENDVLNIPLAATDQNPSDVFTWSVVNLPSNFTVIPGAGGSATIQFQPNYAAAGVYPVTVNVLDNNGGSSTTQFTVTVTDKNPNRKIYVRVRESNDIGAPWNSVTGASTSALKDESNVTTSIGFNLPSTWWGAWHDGPVGNNNGIYPDPVLRDYYYFGIFGGPETVDATITGLDPAKKYNLNFFSASSWTGVPDNGITTFKIGNETNPLYVQNNTQNTANFGSLTPAADGTIVFTMAKGANTPVGYLNAFVITELYDDGTAPAPPKSLTAQNLAGQGVKLAWVDVAYNEAGYEVYRSSSAGGVYAIVGSATAANAETFVDNTAAAGATYYYKVRGVNTYGNSAFTEIVSITGVNRVPVLTPIADVVLKNNQSTTVNVVATDDATDHVTLTVTGLPPFASFVDNGNGTGVISIQPAPSALGSYDGITVRATDNSDSSSTAGFSIFVVENNISSTYINFTTPTSIAAKPWNNFSNIPFANMTLSDLKDDSNISTGVSINTQDGFDGTEEKGAIPGNGTSIYPEEVGKTGMFTYLTNTKRILISGLSTTKRYNFVFFNSHFDQVNCQTTYTINGTSVSLNGSYNANKTVQLNGIVPNASGQVTINVAKVGSASFAKLSSLIIQAYDPAVVPLMAPTHLVVTDAKRTSISLQWEDRASNETGYEIWRATKANPTYTLLTTLGANVTSYTNAQLTPNTYYYYMVRAKTASATSTYSNVAGTNTYESYVYVNFNTEANKPGLPWNNTDFAPEVGAVWNNLKDSSGVLTNIGMVETGVWAGLYGGFGANTTNNSGIFADNVLADCWILFPGQHATTKLTGLNLSKTYDLTFFASTTGTSDASAWYSANGKTVRLNATGNTTSTVTMFGLRPDENGEIEFNTSTPPNTQMSLLGALVIKGYTGSTTGAPQPPVQQGRESEPLTSEAPVQGEVTQTEEPQIQLKATKVSPLAATDNSKNEGILVYPNPVDRKFTLSLQAENGDNVRVLLVDGTGRSIYQKEFNNLSKGMNNLTIEPNKNSFTPGLYVVRVAYNNSDKEKTIKIIKR